MQPRPSDHNPDSAPRTGKSGGMRLPPPFYSSPPRHRAWAAIGRAFAVLAILAAVAAATLLTVRGCRSKAGTKAVSVAETVGAAEISAKGAETRPVSPKERPAAAGGAETRAVASSAKMEVQATDPEALRAAAAAFLSPSADDVGGWFEAVRDSGFVKDSDSNRAAAENTAFKYDEANDAIEVFVGRDDEADGGKGAKLVVPGGFVRLSRIIGAVMAAGVANHTGGMAGDDSRLELLAGKIARNRGRMSAKAAIEMLSSCGVSPEWFQDGKFVKEACDISNGMGMSSVAHAMGHIALGHVRRTIGINAEKARIREDEADAFALSVSGEGNVAASRRMFVGNVYLMLALAARDEMEVAAVARKRHATTPEEQETIRSRIMLERRHPYAGERLAELLSTKADAAKRFGIDPSSISASLRAIGADGPQGHETIGP